MQEVAIRTEERVSILKQNLKIKKENIGHTNAKMIFLGEGVFERDPSNREAIRAGFWSDVVLTVAEPCRLTL